MLSLEELKNNRDLIDEINWDLGPEEAVKLYLEWGNTDWGSGKYTICYYCIATHCYIINTVRCTDCKSALYSCWICLI